MQHVQLRFETDFRAFAGNTRVQAAVMVIPAGESEGGRDNCHRGADQWLYVAAGTGSAWVEGREVPLPSGES